MLSVKKIPKSLSKMPNMTSYLVELSRKLNSENKPHLILQYQWQINDQLNYLLFLKMQLYTSFTYNSSLTFLFWPVSVFLKGQKVISWCKVSRYHHSWKMAKLKSALGLVLLGQDGSKLLRKGMSWRKAGRCFCLSECCLFQYTKDSATSIDIYDTFYLTLIVYT